MWTQLSNQAPFQDALVVVWNREQEASEHQADEQVGIVRHDGRVESLQKQGTFISMTPETMWRHLGWYSAEKVVRDLPEGTPDPEHRAAFASVKMNPVESINIKIPPMLGLALAALVVKVTELVDSSDEDVQL